MELHLQSDSPAPAGANEAAGSGTEEEGRFPLPWKASCKKRRAVWPLLLLDVFYEV